jgi:hypothetical protein
VYEPSSSRLEQIQKEFEEANKPLNVHYDASAEVRAKGAGFYQFSGSAEDRARQMEELRAAREETDKMRKEVGAVEVRPGEVEGLQDSGEGGQSVKGRAMDKRKRQIAERRRAVEAKRRKLKPLKEGEGVPTPSQTNEEHSIASASALGSSKAADVEAAVDQFAALESKSTMKEPLTDPFAVLEMHASQHVRKDVHSQADDFLAQLEREMTRGRMVSR